MSKLVTIAMFSLLSFAAKAEVYNCNFTEPFIMVKIDTDKNTVNWEQLDESVKPSQVSLASLSQAGSVITVDLLFQSTHTDANIKLLIDVDKQGSDGMSDYIYPISAELVDYLSNSVGERRSLYGACVTKTRPVTCPPNVTCG